jgi:phosphoribosylaminoimidazolecarboxamide formyltransferase/IMP cyclohydrolase
VVERALRKTLAREAFERTMRYDTAISAYFAAIENGDREAQSSLPSRMSVSLSQYQKLRYGENPHQSAIWYSAQPQEQTPAEPITFPPFDTLQGKELSSNNIVDTYALVRILRELQPPATCIIKHNNPCGVAIASTLKESYEKAYNTDPLSAFGGIFGFTGEVDEELAGLATGGFIEIIAAPAFTDGALALLSKKKNVRVLVFKPGLLSRPAGQQWQARDLQDFGWIFEKDEEPPAHADGFDCKSGTLSANLKADVGFAWGVVRHLTSNAIFVVKDGVSRGFGIGQTSRIASVNIALAQAGVHAKGAVMASDAFFPATDNIEAAARAGISVIVQPGGSIKDDQVIKACQDNNITMLFTGQRCFKH